MVKRVLFALVTLFFSVVLEIQATIGDSTFVSSQRESLYNLICDSGRMGHRVEADFIPGGIFHTNHYLKGENQEKRTMNHSSSWRLKYACQFPDHSLSARVHGNSYQGVGVAKHSFNPQLGNPYSVFIFQGSCLKKLYSSLSLNYEWDLGLTFGWNPYDEENNPENRIIGSEITAYINADLYLSWQISKLFDLNAGISLSHFSNGNTKIPNLGLNIWGGRVSFAYYLHRQQSGKSNASPLPAFKKSIGFDFNVYGSYRRQGFDMGDGLQLLPSKYAVFGFSLMSLYHVNHWFGSGLSIDGVYDKSANLVLEDYVVGYGEVDEPWNHVVCPDANKQMALGLSARLEFAMPVFSINFGVGHNVIGAHRDLNIWYQILALKVDISNHLFAHIGYSLQNFSRPNHLMLGLGWHF